MNTITFTLKKSLACWVAYNCQNFTSIITAIAVASMGKGMDDDITVTILESEVKIVYQQLTVLPEGRAAVRNKLLDDLLTPLMIDRPELAAQIMEITTSNGLAAEKCVAEGLEAIEHLQTAMNNNSTT